MTKPTREQILSEPAGPRLDAWCAEWVLGIKIFTADSNLTVEAMASPDFEPTGYAEDEPTWFSENSNEYYAEGDAVMLSQGTNPGSAWVLVEVMDRDGWVWSLRHGGKTYFFELIKGDRHIVAKGDTAPLAICRAALLAKLYP